MSRAELPGATDRRVVWPAVGAAAAVAAAVRVSGALHFAFWQDEVGAARIILERTPLGVAQHVGRTERTPPAWYALGWLVHRLGVSVSDVRLLSVLAGLLLAAGLVAYARTMLPLWASALAGLAVALGYQFVFLGRELRAYELHALLSLVLAVTVVACVRLPSRRRIVALALVVGVGALTNYFFVLSVATVVGWLWTSPSARPVRRRATVAIGLGLIPLAVWAPLLIRQYGKRGYSYIGSFSAHRVLTTYWGMFARAQPHTVVLHEAAPLLLAVAVLAGCVLLARRSDEGRLCALLAVTPVAAAALIWLAGSQIFDVRNVIGAGPFAAVALAALVAALPRPAEAIAGCLAVALCVFGYIQANRVAPVAYDRVAQALVAEGWNRSDPILLYGNFYAFRSPLEWYLPGRPGLTLGEQESSSCGPVFVVAQRGPAWGRILHAPSLAATSRVRKILVARLGSETRLADPRWLGSHLVVAKSGHSRCVRAVPERLLPARP